MSEIRYTSKKLEKISLVLLNYQFVPVFTSQDIWNYDMSLPNSPQVECAKLLLKYGKNWNKLKHCRFAEDRRHRYKLGMKKWTEKAIKEHILGSRYDILKSIKKHGFDKKKNSKQPIAVLSKPFWKTRFDYVAEWLDGYEIYHGGRRCAAMYALEYEKVPVFWVEDKKPGTSDGGKYENKVLRLIK